MSGAAISSSAAETLPGVSKTKAEIARSGSAYVISDIALPATQTYAEGSFGNGAFPMAAVTSTKDDMLLKFKNVLGGLKLQLTGTATIASITVTGNNNEILCGAAEVTVSNTTTPTINLIDATAKTVTLDCGEGVQLNSETATLFIIALPPMTMEGGFTVVVTDTDGKQMEIKTTKSQTINRSKLLKMPAVTYEGSSVFSPLTFTSTGETSISLVKEGSPDVVSLEYCLNGGAWTAYTVGDAIALADGEKVSFRAGANGNTRFGKSSNDYHKFAFSGSGTVAASGSVMSLLDRKESVVILSTCCFYRLFLDCTILTTAPDLTATTLAERCYDAMFMGCTDLITAPELPAKKIANNCYSNMFRDCTSLTTAPELPATKLANYCYNNMFSGCSDLIVTPKLPATTLTEGCYDNMFVSCTDLINAPELPATTLTTYCYDGMFMGCTSLTTAPELPATKLANYCYSDMFWGCTSLTTAPELPATKLASYCYKHMFMGCSGLTTAPKLPATTLAQGCYYCMFQGCTSLTTAPELPAKSLANSCYEMMFYGCYSLTKAPELPATGLSSYCYSNMFYACIGLTSASELPATSLASNCYDGMFRGCTSLTTAPELPATKLANYCYYRMFYRCSSLKYIKCLATDHSANGCTSQWVFGVASTGTFVKNKDATWDVTGENGIPEGWTVYPTGLPAVPEAVDLGLSVKWASFNLGAFKPEEYGNYYAWGEIMPKDDYSWETYKWCNGSEYTLTKYNYEERNGALDNKMILDLDDDAANVSLGGSWRMPTLAEAQELLNNCTSVWTTESGVNGCRFTSNIEGYKDKSIFLPYSGFYWTSSLHTVFPDRAYMLVASSQNATYGFNERYIGQSIRPVCP